MNDVITGFGYILAGFKLIVKPRIRLFVITPLLVNTLLFAGIIIYGTSQISDLIAWLSSLSSWTEWISWLLWPLFMIISLIVVFFCFAILANLIAAPFNSFLAAAVEFSLTGEKNSNSGNLTALPAEMLAILKAEARKLLYFIVRALPLLLLLVVPVLGPVLGPVIWFLFGAWMMALEYLDFPMGNHGMLFPQIRQTLAAKRRLTLGFGIGAMLLTMIPVLNFIAMPVAVTGASKLWLDKIRGP
ncbi:MAG: sulfate transporter CysZ [Gammaproteobacteria bacterium]